MSAALLAILVVGFAVSVGAMTAPLWRGRRPGRRRKIAKRPRKTNWKQRSNSRLTSLARSRPSMRTAIWNGMST